MSRQFTKRSTLPAADRAKYSLRLTKLAAYLRTLPNSRYDHSDFVREINDCGPVACAFGHAVASGIFPDINMKYYVSPFGKVDLVAVDAKEGWTTIDYANDYFGDGSYDDAFSSYAFPSGTSVSRSHVIKRLETLANHRYAP